MAQDKIKLIEERLARLEAAWRKEHPPLGRIITLAPADIGIISQAETTSHGNVSPRPDGSTLGPEPREWPRGRVRIRHIQPDQKP